MSSQPGRAPRPALDLRGAVDLSALARLSAPPATRPRGTARWPRRRPRGDGWRPVIAVTEATFAREVMERSATVPVVIDFWATWCEPCKQLSPALERLAAEFGGRFLLATVDVDENQQLAQAFGIQSIPTVVAVLKGRLLPLFAGALPESQVRQYISELLRVAEANGVTGQVQVADPVEPVDDEPVEEPLPPLHQAAYDAIETGDYDSAIAAYEQALRESPADELARVGLAQVRLLRRTVDVDVDAARAAAAANPDDVEARSSSRTSTCSAATSRTPSSASSTPSAAPPGRTGSVPAATSSSCSTSSATTIPACRPRVSRWPMPSSPRGKDADLLRSVPPKAERARPLTQSDTLQGVARIFVVGAGVVGTAVGRAFVEAGHHVTLVDIAPDRVETLRTEGLDAVGRLDLRGEPSSYIVLTLPTPATSQGYDLRAIAAGAADVGRAIGEAWADRRLAGRHSTRREARTDLVPEPVDSHPVHTVVVRSTVPPGDDDPARRPHRRRGVRHGGGRRLRARREPGVPARREPGGRRRAGPG